MKKTPPQKPVFSAVSPSLLEGMPYEYAGKKIEVTIESEEFTCLCPWSGLPDFAYVNIAYVPDRTVIELKSLKMYLQSYRMAGMVHESVVNRILGDLVKAAKPRSMAVELTFNIRGGITTTVKAEYKRNARS
ncbi:MAG: preQ(1) synthase [Endomicrobiales bacterium]